MPCAMPLLGEICDLIRWERRECESSSDEGRLHEGAGVCVDMCKRGNEWTFAVCEEKAGGGGGSVEGTSRAEDDCCSVLKPSLAAWRFLSFML